jgi:hypothetical protein
VIDGPIHDAVIGQSQRGHSELGRARGHAVDLARAVQQRVLAVDVQVDRFRAHTGA